MKKILFFFLLIFSVAHAQDIPKPVTGSYVHDFAGVMTEEQRTSLHQRLIELKKKYTIETAIVTVPTTGEYPIDEYSMKLGREWGVGGKSNNGLVILTAINERKWRIEVGYGLEGDITDAGSKSLAQEYLVPRFKEKNYYQGFLDLINQIDKQIDPETKALVKAEQEKRAQEWEKQKVAIGDFLLNLAFVVFSIVLIYLLYRWRKEVLARMKRELEDARYNLERKRRMLSSLLDSINDVTSLSPTKKQKDQVESIWKKYRDFYRDSGSEIEKSSDVKKINEMIKSFDSNFMDLSSDSSQVGKIRNDLLKYKELKNKTLSYSHVENERESILRSFKNQKLEKYDPEFEKEYAKAEAEHKKYFSQLDQIKSEFDQHLDENRNISLASKSLDQYQTLLIRSQGYNDKLARIFSRAEEDKKFISGFDKSMDFYLKGVLGIAALSFISEAVRNDAKSHADEIKSKAKELEKTPENLSTLKKFMDNIDKGFAKLFKEKEAYDEKIRKEKEKREREEAEERRKKDEEERRRRKKREEEEDEERRRRNSYSSYSSYDSYPSSSSSSSSSDSYSGGSFGGGGSSGDW